MEGSTHCAIDIRTHSLFGTLRLHFLGSLSAQIPVLLVWYCTSRQEWYDAIGARNWFSVHKELLTPWQTITPVSRTWQGYCDGPPNMNPQPQRRLALLLQQKMYFLVHAVGMLILLVYNEWCVVLGVVCKISPNSNLDFSYLHGRYIGVHISNSPIYFCGIVPGRRMPKGDAFWQKFWSKCPSARWTKCSTYVDPWLDILRMMLQLKAIWWSVYWECVCGWMVHDWFLRFVANGNCRYAVFFKRKAVMSPTSLRRKWKHLKRYMIWLKTSTTHLILSRLAE